MSSVYRPASKLRPTQAIERTNGWRHRSPPRRCADLTTALRKPQKGNNLARADLASITTIAPDTMRSSNLKIASITRSPIADGMTSLVLTWRTLGPFACVRARIREKSRSWEKTKSSCRLAQSRISVSGARGFPTCDQWTEGCPLLPSHSTQTGDRLISSKIFTHAAPPRATSRSSTLHVA